MNNLFDSVLIKNVQIFDHKQNTLNLSDVYIENGIITNIAPNITTSATRSYDMKNKIMTVGLVDVHVHLRQPGYEYKETILTGTKAAARGGYCIIFCMPNTKPLIDNENELKKLVQLIDSDAQITTLPYACITQKTLNKNEILTDIDNLSKLAVAFSNDGTSVMNDNLMKEAMIAIKRNNKVLVEHVEDKTLTNNGVIGTNNLAKKYNLIYLDKKSEYLQLERDLKLAALTKCEYHACHMSCKESIDLIRKYQKDNSNITCEVTPHHLLLNESDVLNDSNYKMNPPIRSKIDQDALIQGIIDNTISIIATDHAPHSFQEKQQPFATAPFGIVGIETSFSLLYTKLVKQKIITLKRLIELMSVNPLKRFNLPEFEIKIGSTANVMIFDPNTMYEIDSKDFLSKSKNTPFIGTNVFGRIELTICQGKVVYERK